MRPSDADYSRVKPVPQGTSLFVFLETMVEAKHPMD